MRKCCVQVVTRLDLGGAQRIALQIADFMARQGWESHVIAGRHGEPRTYERAVADLFEAYAGGLPSSRASTLPVADARASDCRFGGSRTSTVGATALRMSEAAHVHLHFVTSLVRPISPLRDSAAALELAGHFRRIRPGIVHTHTSKAGILGRIGARLAGVPARIHTIHGWSFNEFQPAPFRLLFIALERYAASLSTKLVTVCRSDIERGLKNGIGTVGLYEVIRWGVRTAAAVSPNYTPPESSPIWGGIFVPASMEEKRQARRRLGLHPDRPTAGWIGPLKPQKAPLDFVRVAAETALSHRDVQFFMAGGGPLRTAVRQLIESFNLRNRIHLLGWQYDVPLLMHAMDLLVQTSYWEGLPLTLMEAAAAGVPFVATDVGGCRELVDAGLAGTIVPAGAIEAQVEAVRNILGLTPTDFAGMVTATRRESEKVCNLASVLEKTMRLYETTLAQVDKTQACPSRTI